MVLECDRAQFNALIRSAHKYVLMAQLARLRGEVEKSARALTQASILRGMAWRFAKPICMFCWKGAERSEWWRGCDINTCNKCWSWRKDG